MRSGRHKERRIVLGHIVDVNPNRHHAFDQAEWRLDMLKPPLRRPRAEVRCVDPLTDRDRPILMSCQRPVGSRRFVEQDRPHRTCVWPQHPGCDRCDRRTRIEQASEAGGTAQAQARLSGRQGIDQAIKIRKHGKGGRPKANRPILFKG